MILIGKTFSVYLEDDMTEKLLLRDAAVSVCWNSPRLSEFDPAGLIRLLALHLLARSSLAAFCGWIYPARTWRIWWLWIGILIYYLLPQVWRCLFLPHLLIPHFDSPLHYWYHFHHNLFHFPPLHDQEGQQPTLAQSPVILIWQVVTLHLACAVLSILPDIFFRNIFYKIIHFIIKILICFPL